MAPKKVWIMNHYATNSYYNKAGRHYWFAKNLIEAGYDITIFCASTRHNSSDVLNTGNNKYMIKSTDGIPYVFVKSPIYNTNGLDRIKNMIAFYRNLFPVAKDYTQTNGKPDIILASSVHPLTLVAGIKLAKKFGIPIICELRDLWPESIVAYSNLKRDSILAKLLYQGEKWIYKKANKLIFTIEGGKDYIKDRKWDVENGGSIDISKVYHINNGVDLAEFDQNVQNHKLDDSDLEDDNSFKVIYTGSIRVANNLGLVVDAAKYLDNLGEQKNKRIKFIIFGDGEERETLQKKCEELNLTNIVFKGKVSKKYVPYILSKSNLNILNYSNHDIWKYGGSQNKNFEYLASGRPILSTITMGYDLIERYGAGVTLSEQTGKRIGEAILSVAELDKEQYDLMCSNARNVATLYDYKVLSDKLITVFES